MKAEAPQRVAGNTQSSRGTALRCVAAANLVLIFFAPISASAQAMQPAYGWQPTNPYGGQPAPGPQSGYGQTQPFAPPPQYAGPQAYGQEPDAGYAEPPQQDSPPIQPQQPLNVEQLEQLVAPIALYPDTLVAQILAAATYPAQVVDADHWRQAQGYAPPDQIVAGADAQSWDPSLKALTAFPQILAEMDQNLRWTIALGNAYYNQPQDVLDVVQVMRQRAQAAGNLQSTPQEAVSYDQGYIQLAPPNPQVVYVPAYDPWSVYGQPIQPYRGFSLLDSVGSFLGSSPLRYGLGIAMSAFSRTSFGWLGWGLDWLTHSVLFHNSAYASRSTTVADWGLPHGGPRAFAQRQSAAYRQPNPAYRPRASYGRTGIGSNGYTTDNRGQNREFGQGIARPANSYQESRPPQSAYRGYAYSGSTNSVRPPLEATNRLPLQPARPQPYGSSGYGYGFAAPGNRYGARPGASYSAMPQAYRAPASGFPRQEFDGRSLERPPQGIAGRGLESYKAKPEKSGGFHLFGGGHEPKGYGGRESGRGHAERGGHSGGHSSGGHRR